MLGSFCIGTESCGDAFICWVVVPEPLSDGPFHYCGDALFDAAGGFGFVVPYWGKTGHDICTGALVYLFVSEARVGIGSEGGVPVLFDPAARFPFGGM